MLKNEIHMNYALRQHKKIYRSTLFFEKFISRHINLKKKNIIDLACGAGANTMFLAKKFPSSFFLGIDIEKKMIEQAKKINVLNNISFKKFDWLKIKKSDYHNYDGIISFQAVSVLPFWYDKSIALLLRKNFDFLAFSGSFYEGDCEYNILVDDFSVKSEVNKTYHNIFSTKRLKKLAQKYDYKFYHSNFNIDIDLQKPKHTGMSSYTIKNSKGKRMIFSGGLYLPCGFIIFKK